MLNEIKAFFSDLTGGDRPAGQFDDNDFRVAAAALLVHVATLDKEFGPTERDKLHALLKSRFDLDDAATDELTNEAIAADHDAVDFYHFTNVLVRSLDEPGRQRIVEMMWEMVYADSRVTEFEENVMWRVADLLGVSARERIELRRRVAGKADGGDDAG